MYTSHFWKNNYKYGIMNTKLTKPDMRLDYAGCKWRRIGQCDELTNCFVCSMFSFNLKTNI